MNKLAILEGLLFVVGDEGLTTNKISEILKIENKEVLELVEKLRAIYSSEDRGLALKFLGNTFKLTTKNEHKDYYTALLENEGTNDLSVQALEILAIIAYNQPITRVAIDEMRGVNSGYTMRKLCAKGLIRECGKSDLPGRPNLYKTTNDFLDFFGLSSLEELPPMEQTIASDDEEVNLFSTKYTEELEIIE